MSKIRDPNWSKHMWQRILAQYSGVSESIEGLERGLSEAITQETDPTVPAWAKQPEKPGYTAEEVGAIPAAQKGGAEGVAELDESGKVPRSQLPSELFTERIYADTTYGWNRKLTYVPEEGDILIYTDKATYISDGEARTVPGIKIGDGNAYCVDLPFIADDIAHDLLAHVRDTDVHVTVAELAFWNNKINCELDGEVLRFNRD